MKIKTDDSTSVRNHAGAERFTRRDVFPLVGIAGNVCGVDANVLAKQKQGGTASCDATSTNNALQQVVQKQMKG